MAPASDPTFLTGLARFDALATDRGIATRHDVPLGPLTTRRVGGPADRLAEPRSRNELLAVLDAAREAGEPWLVIGNGSDLVVADAGVRGLVIRNRARAIVLDGATVTADAGAPKPIKRTQARSPRRQEPVHDA